MKTTANRNVKSINHRRMIYGFTTVELLIVIAILSIVSSIGIPAYRNYLDTTKMNKVNVAYNQAIRLVQLEYNKDDVRRSLGLTSTAGTSSEEWINIFDKGSQGIAPGGGPTYLAGRPRRREISTTGAVYINYNSRRDRVDIYRPTYINLVGYRARVTRGEAKVKYRKYK